MTTDSGWNFNGSVEIKRFGNVTGESDIYPIFAFISTRISDISPLLEWEKKESLELPLKSERTRFGAAKSTSRFEIY